jgi:hypothetical protein
MSTSRKAVARAERLLAGFSPTILDGETVASLAKRWRETFSAGTVKATGVAVHLGFDWHAFSYEFVFALAGEAARAEYRRKQRPQRFTVLLGETICQGFSCEAETLPWLDNARLDVYVVSEAFTLTMVFTHESGWCGPYFTTAEWAARRAPGSI